MDRRFPGSIKADRMRLAPLRAPTHTAGPPPAGPECMDPPRLGATAWYSTTWPCGQLYLVTQDMPSFSLVANSGGLAKSARDLHIGGIETSMRERPTRWTL